MKTFCDFFGIRIDGVSDADVLSRVASHAESLPFWIVTANPEILLFAKRNPTYAETLRHADLRTADGIGLKIIAALKGARLARTTGVDLVEALARWAAQNRLPVALIGGERPDVAKKALTALQAKIPGLTGIAEAGGCVATDGTGDAANEEARMRIALQNPGVIFVAFGHPKQERWIEHYRAEFPTTRVIMGVGGTFNYLSGALPRAPRWLRTIGLEWLYRLVTEPKRWRRIWNAVIVFPLALFSRQILSMGVLKKCLLTLSVVLCFLAMILFLLPISVGSFMKHQYVSFYFFPYGSTSASEDDGGYFLMSSCLNEAQKKAIRDLKEYKKERVSFLCGHECSLGQNYTSCTSGIYGTCSKEGCLLKNAKIHLTDIVLDDPS